MNDTPAPRRALCAHCQRPVRGCLCRWITPTVNCVPLCVLQHPLEQGHAKGSLPLLRLSLKHCRVETAEVFNAEQQAGWQQPGTWLLYPGNGAAISSAISAEISAEIGAAIGAGIDAAIDTAIGAPGPSPGTVRQLLLLDGTWRKTRKLLHLNPTLQQLPRFALPTPPPSRYRMRKAQQPDQRSTLEAACLALATLEQRPAHYAPLLRAFSSWVEAQTAWA